MTSTVPNSRKSLFIHPPPTPTFPYPTPVLYRDIELTPPIYLDVCTILKYLDVCVYVCV